jgi:TPR repeat protein
MKKPFAHCSLADFVHELQLVARDASGSALSADVVARIMPCLLNHMHTQSVLEQHPLVTGGSGLVCSSAAGSKQAWCSMLRDLFLCCSVSVSNAARLRVYLVVKQCAKLGRVRLRRRVRLPLCGRWSLHMFAALEQLHGARVFLRVCNAQGAALVRIQLAPAAQRLRLRKLVAVYEMAMGHRQRLMRMGCGGRGRLALLMSQGGGRGGPVPQDCSALMDRIVRRVAAAQVAATPEALHAQAQAMRSTGDFAAAAALLQQAVGLGHVLSRADLAEMLIDGREGVDVDHKRAFELVEEGTRSGCCHSQGVMARCYWGGFGCSEDGARALALARTSAGEGSKYGQRMLGYLYREGEGGVAKDFAAAVVQYQLAAAQGYDEAQHNLGFMYGNGRGIAEDDAEALRWYKLAAAQGFGAALYNVGLYYEYGYSVAADRAEAIRWYKRAAAAGFSQAADSLKGLGA